MSGPPGLLGVPVEDLDTPSLVLDLPTAEANIATMAERCRALGVAWRPHTKTCKMPLLAHKMLNAGATGICTAKLSEAETMAAGGLRDILITTEVVGSRKIARLMSLARHCPGIKVVVDDGGNVTALAAAAAASGIVLDVAIEVNVGQNRCGVEPGEALALARAIGASRNLRLCGVQGYEGHLQMVEDAGERDRRCREAVGILVDTAERLRHEGVPVEIVTTAGTGTFQTAASIPGVTEVQPGSFVFMDSRYRACGLPFGTALSVLATVISVSSRNWAVLDVGNKALSTDQGTPEIADMRNLTLTKLSDEHGTIKPLEGPVGLRVGQKLSIIPSHCDTTVNLYDWIYGIRDGRVETVWRIAGRGQTQ